MVADVNKCWIIVCWPCNQATVQSNKLIFYTNFRQYSIQYFEYAAYRSPITVHAVYMQYTISFLKNSAISDFLMFGFSLPKVHFWNAFDRFPLRENWPFFFVRFRFIHCFSLDTEDFQVTWFWKVWNANENSSKRVHNWIPGQNRSRFLG